MTLSTSSLDSRLPPDLAAGSQWLFNTGAEATVTPSYIDGISPEQEAHQRACAVFTIQTLCRMLKLPQLVAASAALYLHRFYMRKSLRQFNYREMVPACIFLATKVEESVRRLRYILDVHFQLEHARERALRPDEDIKLVAQDTEPWLKFRSLVLYNEEELLYSLCFDLSVEHPYAFIQRGVKLVYEAANDGLDFVLIDKANETLTDKVERLTRAAWLVVGDSFTTNLCVLHPPKAIAAMALLVGSRMLRDPLPAAPDYASTSADGVRVRQHWWELFDTSLEAVNSAAVIVDRYAQSTDPHIAAQAAKLHAYAQALDVNYDPPTPPPPPSATMSRRASSQIPTPVPDVGALPSPLAPTSTNISTDAMAIDPPALPPSATHTPKRAVEAEDRARVEAGDAENERSRAV